MSVQNCLRTLRDEGKITPATAAAADALWRRYQGKFSLDLPAASADAAAALQAARTMVQSSVEKKRSVALQTARMTEVERRAMEHEWGPVAGAMAVLTRDIYRRGGDNVDTRTQTIREALFSRFNDGLEAYSSRMAGLKQDIAGAQNMVREIFGVKTGDQVAAGAANGWREATRYGVDYIKAAGKIFEANEDWRLPQAWNSERVRRFGADAFLQDVRAAIDSGGLQIFDKERFTIAADPARREELLQKASRDIITEAGSAPVFSAEMRTFVFAEGPAGAEAWLSLQGKYGGGDDVLSTLRSHLGSMAREAALVDVLGPQHAATAQLLATNAKAAERLDQAGSAWRPQRWLGIESAAAVRRTYDVLSGRANGVESAALAGFFGALRSLMTGSSLGSAVVAAVPGDSLTMALAARWNGMDAGKVLGRIVDSGMTQEQAARLMVSAHAVSDHALGTLRYSDQPVGPQTVQKVTDTVLRSTGIGLWTEGLKKAFTIEMLGFAADQVNRPHGAVDPLFRDFLDRYQITPAEWDVLRARPLQQIGGATFFDSSMAATDPLARKLYEGIITERAYAVLEPDARIRSVTTAGTQAGTIMGEVARNLTQFTSFSMSMMATHIMRIAIEDGSIGSKVLNGSAFFLLHVLAGASIIQARQMLQGKDPIGMDQPKFWTQAAMSGGGLGYFGDLIGGAVEASERSIIGKFSGPIGGLVDDVGRVGHTFAAKGWDAGIGKAIDVVHHVTPGQNVWWARAAIDRLIFDKVHRGIDPDYANGFARREERAMKAYGQRFWWAPGADAPERGPDLGAALGR